MSVKIERGIPAVVAVSVFGLGSCGSAQHKSRPEEASRPASIETVAPARVLTTVEKFARMINHLGVTSLSQPIKPLTDKNCPIMPHAYGEAAHTTSFYGTIEATNGRGGYELTVAEQLGANGKADPAKVVEVDISQTAFTGCKRAISDTTTFTADNPARPNGSWQIYDYEDSGSLRTGQDQVYQQAYDTAPKGKDVQPLTATVLTNYQAVVGYVLHKAAAHAPVVFGNLG